jgi:hypothetical protein
VSGLCPLSSKQISHVDKYSFFMLNSPILRFVQTFIFAKVKKGVSKYLPTYY